MFWREVGLTMIQDSMLMRVLDIVIFGRQAVIEAEEQIFVLGVASMLY